MKPTYEELEAKCQLQKEKLEAINKLIGVIESAGDLAKDGIEKLEQQLSESRREFWAADATINNLELKLAEMAAQLANAESKCAALATENTGLKQALEYVINPDNQPEYHDQGMGCGVEDNGLQTDGYGACEYGWRESMERIYSEVIPEELPETPATDAFLAEVRAQGVEMFGQYHNFSEKLFIQKEAKKFAAQLRQEAAQ